MGERRQNSNDAAVKQAFGRVLKRLRVSRSLTQEELAGLAECSTYYVSLLETGKEGPSLLRILDLATALEVLPQELVAAVMAELQPSSLEPPATS